MVDIDKIFISFVNPVPLLQFSRVRDCWRRNYESETKSWCNTVIHQVYTENETETSFRTTVSVFRDSVSLCYYEKAKILYKFIGGYWTKWNYESETEPIESFKIESESETKMSPRDSPFQVRDERSMEILTPKLINRGKIPIVIIKWHKKNKNSCLRFPASPKVFWGWWWVKRASLRLPARWLKAFWVRVQAWWWHK